MPDIAMAAGDGGRRDRRPPVEVPAEVVKKVKKAAAKEEDDVLPPPLFKKTKKIGGAANFLGGNLNLRMSTTSDKDADWRGIGGISIEAREARLSVSSSSAETHPLAAPSGWRRFWGLAYWWYKDDPEVLVGSFCRACFTDGEPSLCRFEHEGDGADGGYRVCARDGTKSPESSLFVISYRALPNEDQAVDRIGFYNKRRMILARLASVGTDKEIPTSSRDFSPYIRIPPPTNLKTEAPVSGTGPGRPTHSMARPTYSQVRDAYHELKTFTARDPFDMPSEDSKGPVWVSDMHRYWPLNSDFQPRTRWRDPVRESLTVTESREATSPAYPPPGRNNPVTGEMMRSLSRSLDKLSTSEAGTARDEEAPVFGHLWLSKDVPNSQVVVVQPPSRTRLQRIRGLRGKAAASRFPASIASDTSSSQETPTATPKSSSSMASSSRSCLHGREEGAGENMP